MYKNFGDIPEGRSTLHEILDEQSACWARGEPRPAEEFFERFPVLGDSPDAALDVIYQELLLRRSRGERPELEEYIRRFPSFKDQLTRQFAIDHVMRTADETVDLQGITDRGESERKTEGSNLAEVTEAPRDVPGGLFPGYDVLGVIGRGGMGIVYKAWDTKLARVVAIKTITDIEHAGPGQLSRFLDEARVPARLKHPNIVTVYEVGEHEGRPYFALEFVDGPDLKKRLAEKPMSVRDAAALLGTLASAVHAAHKAGIVHRDLKPGNILVTADGVPKVADFGLAKLLQSDSGRTHSGQVVGTPSYMAPEQAKGHSRDVGPTADVYALGAILYEALTGRPPFLGDTPLETLGLVATTEPVSPRQLRPDIPRDLETICLKCLQKESGRRYQDVLALGEDLRRFQAGEPILARPISDTERVWRWCKRNQRVASLSAAIVLLVAIGLVGLGIAYGVAEAQRKKADAAARAANAQNVDLVELAAELVRVLNGPWKDVPAIQKDRERLLEDGFVKLRAALEAMTNLRRDVEWAPEDERHNWRSLAKAHQALARVNLTRNKFDDAMSHFRQMESIIERVVAADPSNRDMQVNLIRTRRELGKVSIMHGIGDPKAAQANISKALEISRALIKANPDLDVYKSELANSLGQFAGAELSLGRLAAARDFYREEIEVRESYSPELKSDLESRRELAGLYCQLAELHVRMGEREEAQGRCDQAFELRAQIAKEQPDFWPAQGDLGLSYNQLGIMQFPQGDDAKAARALHGKALDVFKKRADADPSDFDNKRMLAQTIYYEATCALASDDKGEADKGYRECLKICKELAFEPSAKMPQADLMLALARCGEHVEAAKIAEKLVAASPTDSRLYVQAARGYALAANAVSSGNERRCYIDAAIKCLHGAKKNGWSDVASLETDTDLVLIRKEAGFVALIGEIRRGLNSQ
jgi:eukaryotic-like serine/threonine-protein kinase